MGNLWRDVAYSYVSRHTLEDIHKDIAHREIDEYVDEFIFEREKMGWGTSYNDLKYIAIMDYARKQNFYAALAKKTGTEQAFNIGERIALDKLGLTSLIGGKKK